MAERYLYNNYAEPEFPFDLIRPQLSWLPSYLATHSSDRDLEEPLLNTVLVFGRARTSALLPSYYLGKVRQLLVLLNFAAQSIGATHHLLEIDHCYPSGMFFVTCRRSPRYQWTRPLSHYDIGKNLDYFAPGHITMDERQKTCRIHFLNTATLKQVTCEVVLLDALKNPRVSQEFHAYNKARETLFNSVMQQFGLDYRFKCVLETERTFEDVAATMANSLPPDADWWEHYCFFVNGISFPGVNVDPKYHFCGFHTKYEQHWDLIRKTFHFAIGHNRYEYHPRSEEKVTQWKAMEAHLRRIKSVCEADIGDDYDLTLHDIDMSFESLSAVVTSSNLTSTQVARNEIHRLKMRGPPSPPLMHRQYRAVLRLFRLNLVERYKLKSRLTRLSIDYPQSGDEIVFV
jgi:hypothetical protein